MAYIIVIIIISGICLCFRFLLFCVLVKNQNSTDTHMSPKTRIFLFGTNGVGAIFHAHNMIEIFPPFSLYEFSNTTPWINTHTPVHVKICKRKFPPFALPMVDSKHRIVNQRWMLPFLVAVGSGFAVVKGDQSVTKKQQHSATTNNNNNNYGEDEW